MLTHRDFQAAKEDYLLIMRGKWNGKREDQLELATQLIFDRKFHPLVNHPKVIDFLHWQLYDFACLIPWFFPEEVNKHSEVIQFLDKRARKMKNDADLLELSEL